MAFSLYLVVCVSAFATESSNWFPKDGVIPDEDTAGKVAYIILDRIYGVESINKQRPFEILGDEEKWVVKGVLHGRYTVGGVAEIELSKKDGRVLMVTHGK